MSEEKTIVIDVHLSRRVVGLLVGLLLVVGAAGALLLTYGRSTAAPAAASAVSLRQYYLTISTYYGNHAADAEVCASGYHFASFWEIAQTATLRYNTSLGYVSASTDQGEGPTQVGGWVRTGGGASGLSSDPPGTANCNNWTTSGYGTTAAPLDDWTASSMLGWKVTRTNCIVAERVWCREDAKAYIYLPAVQR